MASAAETQKFTQALTRTNAGIKFGRALFSPGNKGLSPRAIADMLRLLGLNIPQGYLVAVDMAQVLVSGAAVCTAVQEYETIDDIESVANPSIGTVKALLQLAGDANWIDPHNQYVEMVEVGIDAYQIYASMGMDVKAWISLGLHIASFEAYNSAKAEIAAHQAVADGYRAIISPEATAAASVFKQYQESEDLPDGAENKLSVYGFIGKIASVAPDLWPQYFPGFGWMPETVRTIVSNTASRTWYGSTSTAHAEYSWKSLYSMTDDQIRQTVFGALIYPYMYPFQIADQAFGKMNKASLFTMAQLACLSPMKYVYADQDLSGFLGSARLTPKDFGETVVQDYLSSLNDDRKYAAKVAGVTIQGVAQKAGVNYANAAKYDLLDNLDLFKNADRLGDVDTLFSNPDLKKTVADFFTFPAIPKTAALGAWNESVAATDRAGNSITRVIGAGAAWRDPKNYFASMGFIDTLSKDPFFKNSAFMAWLYQTFYFMKDIKTFETVHRQLQMKQTLRAVNFLAKANIARFLGT